MALDGKIGGVPKKVLAVGGLVAVGVLGYAYMKQGSAEPVADPAYEAAVDEYDSPLGNSGTNSTATVDNADEDKISTNAQWTQAAVEYLQGVGVDAAKASAALGKLLAFKTLTPFEESVAQQAKAAYGEPPQGGPYPIKPALPTPTTPSPNVTAAPSGLKAANVSQTTALIDWNEMKGNVGYRVTVHGPNVNKEYFPLWSWQTIAGLQRKKQYTISVCGRSATGKMGPTSAIKITTK